MPDIFAFFDRFKAMIQADPWQAVLLMSISAALGWYACRFHFRDRIAHWRDRSESKAEREAEAKTELEKQRRMTMKQKDPRRK